MAEEQSTVEYRNIPDFPGYRIGSDGSIWSCWKGKWGMSSNWRKLKPQARESGHLYICLCPARIQRSVHSLVLETFVGPCPEGCECLHRDGNPQNNRVDNLRWGTHKENGEDMSRHLSLAGEKNGHAILTKEIVLKLREEYSAGGISHRQLAEKFRLLKATVTAVLIRKNWKHV